MHTLNRIWHRMPFTSKKQLQYYVWKRLHQNAFNIKVSRTLARSSLPFQQGSLQIQSGSQGLPLPFKKPLPYILHPILQRTASQHIKSQMISCHFPPKVGNNNSRFNPISESDSSRSNRSTEIDETVWKYFAAVFCQGVMSNQHSKQKLKAEY